MLQGPWEQPLVYRDTLLRRVEGNFERVKKLLGVLPDLGGVCA